jgi:hypothetical protein
LRRFRVFFAEVPACPGDVQYYAPVLWLGILAVISASSAPVAAAPAGAPVIEAAQAERFARLALTCVHREYPNKIAHVLASDADVLAPRVLTPAFYGCYDWHSSVHGHWLLARLARLLPTAPFAREARAALARSLTPEAIAGEVRYLEGKGRASFERPYGLAWLLQLAAELRAWPDPDAQSWSKALAPLEAAAVARLSSWLPKMVYPIRVGEHSQTAFAFGLMLDWSKAPGVANKPFASLVDQRARSYYQGDHDCALAYEPSGEDFLSPCLAEADLMRRVLAPGPFARWLSGFMPRIPRDGGAGWLPPGVVTDRADPKLAHIDGLNLSRAWMLEGIAAGLPAGDRRVRALQAAASAHRTSGLAGATGAHYEGGHWLGTFAIYLLTGRGLPIQPAGL